MLELLNNIEIPNFNVPQFGNIQDLLALLSAKYEHFHASVLSQFGPNGLYILTAFALFIFLIIIIYIKSVIDMFSASNEELAEDETNNNAESEYFLMDMSSHSNVNQKEYSQIQNENTDANYEVFPQKSFKENDEADLFDKRKLAIKEKEEELSKDIIQTSAVSDDYLQLKNSLRNQTEAINRKLLDWNKFDIEKVKELNSDILHYRQQKQSLDELICLIINMLGREISESKIVQTIYARNMGDSSAEDIMQIVGAVRDFIAICNAKRFDNLENRQSMPSNNEALYNWALGDNSQCLQLLEALVNQEISNAENVSGLPQTMLYAQASNDACLMGNIASLNNKKLAQNSFELAIELSPNNVNAWSRAADMYLSVDENEKALNAYQKVLDIADNEIFAEQVANAQINLVDYYKSHGKMLKANELETSGNLYYKESGINSKLTEQEESALGIIASKQGDNLQSSIIKLLNNNRVSAM